MSKSYNNLEEIEWTPKNIIMISLAVLFLIAGVVYGLVDAANQKAAKRAKIEAMTVTEVGEYIIKHNGDDVRIDMITRVKKMYLKGETLYLPYYVQEGFLRKLSSTLVGGVENNQYLLQHETLKEDCEKLAFRIFLEKGGVMHYEYKMIKEGEEKALFGFENRLSSCLDAGL